MLQIIIQSVAMEIHHYYIVRIYPKLMRLSSVNCFIDYQQTLGTWKKNELLNYFPIYLTALYKAMRKFFMSRVVRVTCMHGSSELIGTLARLESSNPIVQMSWRESTDLLKGAYFRALKNPSHRHIRIWFEIQALPLKVWPGTSFFSSLIRHILKG